MAAGAGLAAPGGQPGNSAPEGEMKDERRGGASQKVDELFHAALDRQPTERYAFLAEGCGGNTDLLAEVESLISAHERAQDFLESPAVELVAGSFAEVTTRLARGQQLGPYTIVGPLGMGGMGEVYRARDSRLQRSVAIGTGGTWSQDGVILFGLGDVGGFCLYQVP